MQGLHTRGEPCVKGSAFHRLRLLCPLVIVFHPFEQNFTQAVNEVGSVSRLTPPHPRVVARSILHVHPQHMTDVFHHTPECHPHRR